MSILYLNFIKMLCVKYFIFFILYRNYYIIDKTIFKNNLFNIIINSLLNMFN
jgi:hypothetical protein